MSDPGKAVFLSYASQDAEAAKRIAEALRAAGVEVWFDQNELVGGDAWDAKIRKQIGSCALFVPIISASTQARAEGYFRLEWKLADRRTDLIGKSKAFLLPVCIDDTRDSEADVPDTFTAVQWTRLKGGVTTPAFVGRVQKLLGGSDVGSPLAATSRASQATPLQGVPTASRKVYAVIAVAAFAIAGAAGWWILRDRGNAGAAAIAPAPLSAPVTPLSEARQLANKAKALIADGDDANREALVTAEELLKRAVDLAPADGEVTAIYAQVSRNFDRFGYDRSSARRDLSRRLAERAVMLAPDSAEAQFALAYYYYRENPPEAERMLREMLVRQSDDKRLLFTLGLALRQQGARRQDEALETWQRAANLPGSDAASWAEIASGLEGRGKLDEAEAALDRSLALKPGGRTLMFKLRIQMFDRGDLDGALATFRKLPPWAPSEDRGAFLASQFWLWRRQPDQAIAALSRLPRDYLSDNQFTGPKQALTGQAHQLAGRTAAARSDWNQALQLVERMLATERTDALLYWRAWLQAALRDQAAAEASLRTYDETARHIPGHNVSLARIQLLLGHDQAALTSLESNDQFPGGITSLGLFISRRPGALRFDPAWDPLRGDPRFQALLAKSERFAAPSPISQPASLSSLLPMDAKSVAVLAFANLSDDKSNEYFSDGISEELLNVLAKVPGLKVSARTSAFHFKGKDTPIPEIARQLGVAYVVEGSVRKAGDKVRITAQLIKAADGFHVWSDTFTRDLKDIFAVQDEIAGLIAKNLELKMGMVAARPTVDLEAYQEYLTGRSLFAKASNADLRAAVGHFERAVAIEPKFTAAWVQLASAHTRLGRWGGTPSLRAWAAAQAAIDKARALEPESPEVLLALGWILRTAEWDWRGAEQAFRRALQLQPNQPDALAGAAVLLFNIGQTEEAYRLAQRAVQLDPLNAATQIDLSIMFYMNKNWVEAERSARRALQLAPGGTSYRSILSWSLIGQRRFAEAEAEIAQDQEGIDRTNAQGLLAIARGQENEARGQLARLEAYSRIDGDLADLQQSIAWLCAYLGEKDRAFAALEKAAASRDPSMSWLINSWYLEPLYSDPRWPIFLRKVGLTDDQLK